MGQRRERLIALGADALADILLDAEEWNEDVQDKVDRAIAPPAENVRRFKAKLRGIGRRKGVLGWGESTRFARELEGLLDDLRAGIQDPMVGVELTLAFYEGDDAVFHYCDDSLGNIGDVFRHDAAHLFAHYASQCEDKRWLCDQIVKVLGDDGFGVRDSIVSHAAEYLPEPDMRNLVGRFRDLAQETDDEYGSHHWTSQIETLARQLKDAPLFEQTRCAAWPDLSTASCLDIARVYLECDDARSALTWIERLPKEETFRASARDDLLLRVYEKLGKTDKMAEIAWRQFRSYRSVRTLDALLAIIGEERREEVLQESVEAIRAAEGLIISAVVFLVDVGRMDAAEERLIARADELDGEHYSNLLPLAQAMEGDGRLLAAALAYRALLDSILRRGISKYYHHGVRYLKKLDDLSPCIADWRAFPAHPTYVSSLRDAHGRKRSFWSRYGDAAGG